MLVLVVALAVFGRAWAVFRDDAFRIDWALSTIGVPVAVGEFGNNSLAVLTERSVLAALSADGFTSWRKALEPEQVTAGLAVTGDTVVVGGDVISGFNSSSGALLWTINHAAAAVWTDVATGQTVVDGKYAVSEQGTLAELEHPVQGGPPKLDGRVAVRAGTLKWDRFGVLTLNPEETAGEDAAEPIWMRNEGLTAVVDALFVPAAADVDDEHEKLLEDYAELVDPSVTGVRSWTSRVIRHIDQLKRLALYAFRKGVALILLPSQNDSLFGFDQLLVVVTESGSLYALNTLDTGTVAWVYHDLDAVRLERDAESADQFKVIAKDAVYSVSYDGVILGLAEPNPPTPVTSVVTIDTLEGVRVSSELYGWSLLLPGTKLVGAASRDPLDKTASTGLVVEESHVRYKYLNPYAAVYATYDPAARALSVSIVDTVSGRILAASSHPDPVIVNDEWPFNIVFGEHWIAYTYLSQDLSVAPKITVWELYESPDIDTRVSPAEVDPLADQLLPFVAKYTWIAPSRGEPVYSLALSRSAHGAVTRELILGLQHQLVALPKWTVNTLNPQPELQVPQQSHLSHIYGVNRPTTVVTSPTKIESTYLVAALGGADVFFTRALPSGEIDFLGQSFPRLKLIIFVVAFGFLTTTLAPLARRKTLQAQWR